jgi:hypothetical protein
MSELTESQKNELRALVGDKEAICRVVSDLRKYRDAVKTLLSLRYLDGEYDTSALNDLEMTASEIEEETDE